MTLSIFGGRKKAHFSKLQQDQVGPHSLSAVTEIINSLKETLHEPNLRGWVEQLIGSYLPRILCGGWSHGREKLFHSRTPLDKAPLPTMTKSWDSFISVNFVPSTLKPQTANKNGWFYHWGRFRKPLITNCWWSQMMCLIFSIYCYNNHTIEKETTQTT